MTRNGFTLVDLVIGIAACGIVAFVGVFLVMPADNWIFIIERRSGITDARVALVRMIRETGSVRAPGDVTSFTPTRFAFVNIGDEAVSFEKSGTDILRSGTDVLARNVQSLLFEYLADDGSAAAVAADIRVVRMTIALVSGNHQIKLQSAAQLKNGVPQ